LLELPPFLVEFLRRWNARDIDGVVAAYSPDGEMIDPMTGGKPIRGHAAVRHYYTSVWDSTPDAVLEGLAAESDENGFVWMWRFSGSTQERRWSAVGASYLRLDDQHRILWDHAVWDLSLSL
jgi:hypothetical protein